MTTTPARPFSAATSVTPLLRVAALRPDWQDCQRLPVSATAARDPRAWADAIFHDPPPWVAASLRLRDRVVSLLGMKLADTGDFPIVARADDEVLVGSDDRHLDFRASVHRTDDTVDVVTVVQTHNRLGRLYLIPVRMVHGVMVRRMLRRASRSLDRPR
jgi:hypothetical protein